MQFKVLHKFFGYQHSLQDVVSITWKPGDNEDLPNFTAHQKPTQ